MSRFLLAVVLAVCAAGCGSDNTVNPSPAPPTKLVFTAALSRLSRSQVVALRFASDAELPALLERAEREHLTGDQIKRAIKDWVADLDRT